MITNTPLRKAPLFGLLAAGLSACSSPSAYETEPVEVDTPAGVVICQLYTRNLVVWDRAIDRPPSMSVTTADAICVNEGKRRA
jgi:hypothetical protein